MMAELSRHKMMASALRPVYTAWSMVRDTPSQSGLPCTSGTSSCRTVIKAELSVSAISDVGGAYAQNVRTLPKYYEAIGQGRLPTVRGMHLSPEDERRRTLITQLMCNLNVSLDEGERRHFANALAALKPLVADGLVEPTAAGLRVTDLGRIFLRNVAMPFDEYLPGSQHRFSRTV